MRVTLPSLSWIRFPWTQRIKPRWNYTHIFEKLDVLLDKPIAGIHIFGGKDFEPGPALKSSSPEHLVSDEFEGQRRVQDLESRHPTTPSGPDRLAAENDTPRSENASKALDSASPRREPAAHPEKISAERVPHLVRSLPTPQGRSMSLSAADTSDNNPTTTSIVLRRSSSTSQLNTTCTRSTCHSQGVEIFERDSEHLAATNLVIGQPIEHNIRHESESHSSEKTHKSSLTWWETLCVMCAKMIGVSIMAMPNAFEELGILTAAGMVVVIGTLCFIGARGIWEFRMAHPEVQNMAEMFEKLFSHYGTLVAAFGYWLGLILVTLFNSGVMAVHLKLSGVIIEKLIGGPLPFGDWSSATISSLVVAIICTFLCVLSMRFISICGVFSCFLTVLFIIVFLVSASPAGSGPVELSLETLEKVENMRIRIHALYNTEATWGGQCGAIVRIAFAFLIHTSIPIIMGDMQKPRDFPKALAINFVSLSFFLILFGSLTCYYMTPQHLEEMPWNMVKGISGTVCAPVVLFPCVLQGLVYGRVNAEPAADALSTNEYLKERKKVLLLFKFLVLLVFWLVAWALACIVPKFGNLLAIVGGIFGCIFATTLPAVLDLVRLVQDSKGKSLSEFVRTRSSLRTVNIVVLLGCAIMLAYATIFPIGSFREELTQTIFCPFVYNKPDEPEVIEELPAPTTTMAGDHTPSPTSTAYLATETDADNYAM